jgi:predicted deacylase
MPTEIGSARADANETARGHLDVTGLPTGTPERLPVVVTEGATNGSTVWITASVYGDEATGLTVAHDVVDAFDPGAVRGTVVCLPVLDPAGVHRNERTSYYHDEDPNRGFPNPELDHHRPPTAQELVDERVYECFADADCPLDLHTATTGSMPFVVRDRVLYRSLS